MMRSMYSGISGIRAHQIKMDVVANNIANVNTVGYKASRVTFQEVLNQTIQPAFASDGSSIGALTRADRLGVSVGALTSCVPMVFKGNVSISATALWSPTVRTSSSHAPEFLYDESGALAPTAGNSNEQGPMSSTLPSMSI